MSDINNAIKKVSKMEWLESRSIISVDAEHCNACIHELLYKSLSNKGIVKFVNALYFYFKLKRAAQCGSGYDNKELLNIYLKHEPGNGRRRITPVFRFDGNRFLAL